MAAVREDVVKIGFDADYADLTKLKDELDAIKALLISGLGEDTFDEMIKESKKAAQGVEDVKDSVNGIKPDGLDDTVKGLKDTEKEGEDAHKQLKKIAQTSFNKTVSGLKNIVTTLGRIGLQAGKVLAKGIVAGAAGVGALVGQAISNYADYEQLVGGVETLFKDSAGTVQKYADDAFKTAGLSANAYMETVTSFSASLIQGLGGNTGAAAEYAHMAIVDMSDNANKMGTDIAMIQDAYQGFAKDNYTMLDNLKLGYGGTQSEMARLINDSGVLGDSVKVTAETVKDVPFDKIIQAIHKVQEEIGITGTTAKEAENTISGSWSSLKAAWSNTLTSLILGGDDFDRCIDNLVDAAKTFGKNIMPAIVSALEGVGSLIEELAPLIEKELPGLVDTLLPPLIKAATSIVSGLIVALPDIVGALIGELPGIMSQLWEAVTTAFGEVPGLKKAKDFLDGLVKLITDNADAIKKLIPAAFALVMVFKLFNKFKGLSGLFGGGKGGAGGGFFSGLASMNPKTALKGILNLTIIVGGLSILAAALMAAAPYMAKLSDMKSIGEVLLVIGAVGLLGTGMTKLAASVGNIPVATVAKGLANIAIVMVGFGALAAVLMWVAPYMAELSNLGTTMKILIVIGAVGLVGSALAGLAGLVGAIPIALVLSGLGNIALALGGFSAIAVAFGALQKVDGFTELLNNGGQVLSDICGIIGDMAGNLVGSFAEGVTDSLPAIGENLAAFATSIQPMFDTFSGVDTEGLSSFASSLAALIAVIAGEQITSIITGGIDYAGLGTNLSTMASNMSGFFTDIMAIPDGAFEKATALFDCLAGIKGMPKEGGVVGWFQGEVNFSTIATGLTQLAGAAGAFTTIQAIPEEAFTKMSSLFDCLAGIKSLPQDGGVVGWFMGEVNFTKIASGIQSLASGGTVTALTTLATIPLTAFVSLTALFNALAGIKAMPKEGGIAGWFGGDSSTGLSNIASQLPGVATNIASFFANLGGRTDFSPISSLFNTLSSIKIDSDAAEGTGLFGLGASALETMGTGLSNFATNAKTFFDTVNTLNVDGLSTFFDELGSAGDLPETLSGLDGTIGTALSNIVSTSETKLTELKGKFSDVLGQIVQLLNATATATYTSGVAITTGLNNGMASMLPTLVSTARTMAQAIQNAFDVELDINSPSKVMEGKGMDTGMGQVVGMRKSIPYVQDAATDVARASIPYSSHYSPDGDASTVYNNRTSSEYTTISPSFNLTISGTQDDRATARKVKRWVNESMNEFFESMERKSYVTREA